MSRIQVIAPEGMKFRLGGKPISDQHPIWVNDEEYRVRKHLMDGSILLYDKVLKEVKEVKEEASTTDGDKSVESVQESVQEFVQTASSPKPNTIPKHKRKGHSGKSLTTKESDNGIT